MSEKRKAWALGFVVAFIGGLLLGAFGCGLASIWSSGDLSERLESTAALLVVTAGAVVFAAVVVAAAVSEP